VNKSSFLNNKLLNRSNIALICILGMGVGFLRSTAILSIFTFLFGVNGLWGVHPRLWVRNKWWLLGLAWVFMYAITYFWSADKAYWGVRLQTKLPFLILPLAISFLPRFSAKQVQQIAIILVSVSLASAGYSLFFMFRDPAYYMFGYRVAHLLPTLPDDDYIRSSLFMALTIIWSVYAWPSLQSKAAKWFITCSCIFVALFMHLLAAKTGLISLYFFLIAWSLYMSFGKRKIVGIIALVAIPVCFMLAVRYVPTLRERAGYIQYSYEMMRNGDRTGNYGDVNRLMSYKLAAMLISEHPLFGVGTGDMMTAMFQRYKQWYPQVPDEDVLLPHDQFLIVALGCGIPAFLLFAIWVFMPLAKLKRNRQGLFFFIVWGILLFQLMIEPVLEIQNGVWVFLFFLMLQKHELEKEGDLITE